MEGSIDVTQYLNKGFDTEQIEQIKLGIDAGVDVSKFASPQYAWFQMEEIRIGLMHGMTVEDYVKKGYDWMQIGEITKGLEDGLDVAKYSDIHYTFLQMEQIRKGLEEKLNVDLFANESYDPLVMREIRKGLKDKINLLPYVKEKYSGKVLKQIRKSIKSGVDITKYAKEGYDDEQLEEIRYAKEYDVNIEPYLSKEYFGNQLREIRYGVENNIDVSVYATGEYNWRQMEQIRICLEEHLNIEEVARPLIDWKQMEQIRLGLEQYIDVTKYSSAINTAEEMKEKREKLLETLDDDLSQVGCQITAKEVEQEEEKPEVVEEVTGVTEEQLAYGSVRISPDELVATLELVPPKEGTMYTIKQVEELLVSNKVIQGIDYAVIKKMVTEGIYFQEMTVAVGKERINGTDGFFTFYFRTDLPTTPKLLDDGSVDFHSMDLMELVSKGQKLAEYTPATNGQYGYSVTGKLQIPTKGKDKVPLRGKGFVMTEDRKVYIASIDGKIEVKNNTIMEVSRIFVINGNIDAGTGDIDFDGDLLIKGDVLTGFSVKATGNIQITGFVEKAYISGGLDVVIKGGVNGGNEGAIYADRDIYGSFFETTTVKAKGQIHANYVLNSNIIAEDSIYITGKKGSIIGGTTKAVNIIESSSVGNISQTPTMVYIGINQQMLDLYHDLIKKISKVESEIAILEKGKLDIEYSGSYNNAKARTTYDKILQALSIKTDEKKSYCVDREKLGSVINTSGGSRFVVKGTAFAGTHVVADMVEMLLKDKVTNVYFCRVDKRVGIFRRR